MELREAIKGYLLDGQVRGLTPRTLEWYRQKLQHFATVLEQEEGVVLLKKITPVHLRAFVLHMQQTKANENNPVKPTEENRTVSPLTVKGYVQVIKGFFTWCVEEELLSGNPAQRLKLPKVPDYLIVTFAPEQIQAMLSSCNLHTRLSDDDHFCRRRQSFTRKNDLFFAEAMAHLSQTMQAKPCQGTSAATLTQASGMVHCAPPLRVQQKSL
jgi:site-specific recombinase XerD